MAMPGPAALAFTPLPTPSISLFSRRATGNDANAKVSKKGVGRAKRPATSPGNVNFSDRPTTPPPPVGIRGSGEIGERRGAGIRRISLFHRPLSVVFAGEEARYDRRENGNKTEMESTATGGATTPIPPPRKAGIRARAMSIASFSTPSTPSSTTSTPSTSPASIQPSIYALSPPVAHPRAGGPYPGLKRPTSSGGESTFSTMSTSSTASRSDRLATRIGAFFTRSSPLKSRGGSDVSDCGGHSLSDGLCEKDSLEAFPHVQGGQWGVSTFPYRQPGLLPSASDIRFDEARGSDEMRAEHVVEEDIEDVSGGGGVVQEQGGHGGRVVQMASEISASKSSTSSKFMEDIGGGEGDDGGTGERADGARDRDGSRGGGSSGCIASAGEGAQGQLDIHADVDIRLLPLGACPSSPPQPQNSTGQRPPIRGDPQSSGDEDAGSSVRPHNDPALSDEEDVTRRREELVEIADPRETTQPTSPAQPILSDPIPPSQHTISKTGSGAPSSSSRVSPPLEESPDASKDVKENSPNQPQPPGSPTPFESQSDADGNIVGVQPCRRNPHIDRVKSWVNNGDDNGISNPTNSATSRVHCRSRSREGDQSTLPPDQSQHPSAGVENRAELVKLDPSIEAEPRHTASDIGVSRPQGVPSLSEHGVEVTATTFGGQPPSQRHSPPPQGLEEAPRLHSPSPNQSKDVVVETSPTIIYQTDAARAKMLSSSHQSSSVSASGHPPYPYHGHHSHHNNPYSHHGHGSQGISYLSQGGSSGSRGYAPYQRQGSGSGLGASSAPVVGSPSGEGARGGSGMTVTGGGRQQPQLPPLQGQGRAEGGQAAAKANLKAWWNQFNFVRGMKKDVARDAGDDYRSPDSLSNTQGVVFGKPLKESLKYASVQISTANADGVLYVWGYIPVVVAKCGLYLKEKATEVPGTFRVNGSNRRIRELQAAFETAPRYGKNLDWKQESYTTHDVASVFRRYLTQMPEPVIPYDLYHQFRDALGKEPYNQDEVIARYKQLIRQMPRSNQYLLLYVLDLLSVFARKSDKNLMTAGNLAVIFRPGVISHPQHEMAPHEHALSQKVLEFLIAHQDHFMLEIPPVPQRRGSGQQQQQTTPQHSQSIPNPTSSSSSALPTGQQASPPNPMPAIHERRPSDTQFMYPSGEQQDQVVVGNLWASPSPNVSSGVVAGGVGSSSLPSAAAASGAVASSAHAPAIAFGATPTPPRDPHAPPRRAVSYAPPPHSEMGSEATVDDVMVIPPNRQSTNGAGSSSPGSDTREEYSGIGGGGWKLVSRVVGAGSANGGKEKEKKIRRRTTMERSDLNRASMLEEGDMTPDPDRPLSYHTTSSGGASVKRSRTLPSGSSKRRENNSGGSNDSSLGGLALAAPIKDKENALVSFAEGTSSGGAKGSSGTAKERRSVLVKKSRRASASVPNVSGGGEVQRT